MKPAFYMVGGSKKERDDIARLLTQLYSDGVVRAVESGTTNLGVAAHADVAIVMGEGDAAAGWCRRIKEIAPLTAVLLVAERPAERADGFLVPGSSTEVWAVQLRTLLRLKRHEETLREQERHLQRELDKRSQILRQTEHRFRVIYESSPDAIFVEDESGRVMDVNPAACRLHGLSKNRLVGLHVSDLVPPSQRDAVRRDYPMWFTGAVQVYEGYSYTDDRRVIPVEIKASRIEYNDQPALLLMVRDISERRTGEERRMAIVQGLRAVADMADELISCHDVSTLHRKAVELARQRLGLERCSIFLADGLNVKGTFGTNIRGEITDERSHRLPMDDTWLERFRLRGPNEPRWSLSLEHLQDWQDGVMQPRGQGWVAITPIQTARKAMGVFCNDAALTQAAFDPMKQEIVAVYCSLLANIMERKAAESERSRLSLAVEQSAEAVLVTDASGIINYVNPAFERITGYRSEEVMGRNPRLLKSGRHTAGFYEQLWSVLRRGDAWTGRIINRRKDGSMYTAEQTISTIRDGQGQTLGYLTVSQDITRSLKLEDDLRQAQKLDSIGRLAGGMAHDFNNLLTGILGFTKVVKESLGPRHPALPDLEEIERAGERAAHLSRELLAFGHRQVLHVQPLDLNEEVRRLKPILQEALGPGIELQIPVDQSVGRVEVDPGLLERLLLNVLTNARDAIAGRGHVTIATSHVETNDALLARHPAARPGHYVLLSVKDTGEGMPEDVRQRAFEPFYTTRDRSQHAGLGLSTVYGIVRQLGGFIELESGPEKGTEVRHYFPLSASVHEPTAPAAIPAVTRGNETILVVEDENTVRRLTVRLLQGLGYQVLEARDGEEAMAVYEQRDGAIDLLLSDVLMPNMGGTELAARLRRQKPSLKVLFMSGYTQDVRMEGLQADGTVSLILKPFTRESMCAEIRRMLDRNPDPSDQ